MFVNKPILEINQINLFGFTRVIPNRNAISEGFANMNLNYSSYSLSTVLKEENNTKTEREYNITNYTSSDTVNLESYISIILSVVLVGIIYCNFKK
jgi:hypothetical protein